MVSFTEPWHQVNARPDMPSAGRPENAVSAANSQHGGNPASPLEKEK